jgi:hypothetical protein
MRGVKNRAKGVSRRVILLSIIATLHGLLVADVFLAFGQVDQKPPGLTFTVRSASTEYGLSEFISLTLTLSLDPNARTDVTVTTFEAGTISVVSATRDGESIEAMKGAANFVEDPVLLQVRFLRTIAPGKSVTIPFEVQLVPGQGSLLTVEQLDPQGAHTSLIYPLVGLGLYRLQFLYKYTGPDNGRPNVFRGSLLSNEVHFRLR